ncbi:MAG: cytochrome c [Neorhizobium sp.]|nr:cytochrome c [Neorhizobium sp.]
MAARNWISSAFAAATLSLAALAAAGANAQDANDPALKALIEKGRMVAVGADCMACHTVPEKGKPFAGGYGIVSPLGTIYSTNITPSKADGIGNYSEEDFSQAVRHGVRKDGAHLYPAMPYDSYAEITDGDLHALYAYFMHGVDPVDDTPKDYTSLPFPFNLRFSMAFWNMLYAGQHPFTDDPKKSAELNRGAYVADALGHCGSCHTPRGMLMGAVASAYLSGGPVGPWYAPNITSDKVSGIGDWSTDDLVAYFGTGRVAGKAQAAGGMAEAVHNSLQNLPQSDLRDLALYLKSVPAIRDPLDTKAAHTFGGKTEDETAIRGLFPSNAHDSLHTGAELYSGYCASCHQPDGAGSENQAYPSLFHNTATGSSQPANLVAAILYGVDREADGHQVLMPSFSKGSYVAELNDKEVADISNYVLTKFGNPDAHVSLEDVATARKGGPVPLIARLQPQMMPAMIVGAGIALIVLITLCYGLVRYRRRASA